MIPVVVGPTVEAASVKVMELMLTVPPAVGVDVAERFNSEPLVSEVLVKDADEPVVSVDVNANLLVAVSHPKPDVSEVIDPVPLKNAICPLVPLPETPPTPTVQVTT